MRQALSILLIILAAIITAAILVRFLATLIPGATVTSWYRTPWKNIEVGGANNSAHLFGWAIDLVPATSTILAAAKARFPFVLHEGDHIHAGLMGGHRIFGFLANLVT